MKKKILLLCTALAVLLPAGGCARQTPEHRLPENITQTKEHQYTCTFENESYSFILDLPEQPDGAPLILMLHGYGDSAEGFRSSVHLERQANPLGYAVVYASGGLGWNAGMDADDKPDREFLVSLADYLQETYALDASRIYAAGFSNGACMAHRLAAEAPETFSACVSVCGMMPARIRAEQKQQPVGFFQITGGKDAVVPKNSDGSAEHTDALAIEDVMDAYVQSAGLTLSATEEAGRNGILKKYSSPGSRKQVWDLFFPDGTHGWQCGGADTCSLILEFLETQK